MVKVMVVKVMVVKVMVVRAVREKMVEIIQ